MIKVCEALKSKFGELVILNACLEEENQMLRKKCVDEFICVECVEK